MPQIPIDELAKRLEAEQIDPSETPSKADQRKRLLTFQDGEGDEVFPNQDLRQMQNRVDVIDANAARPHRDFRPYVYSDKNQADESDDETDDGELIEASQSSRNGLSVQDRRLPHGPLRKLNPRHLNNRLELMAQLNTPDFLQMNQFGMPDYIYRVDVLSHTDFAYLRLLAEDPEAVVNRVKVRQMLDILGAAVYQLSYTEGFPTLGPTIKPFWAQLEWEEDAAYASFVNYLSMAGIRQLKVVGTLTTSYGTPDDRSLAEWYNYYYWPLRVKSYDLFRAVQHQKLKESRILECENEHYEMADKLLRKVTALFNDNDFVNQMSPAQAIGAIKDLAKIQRDALGLNNPTLLKEPDKNIPRLRSTETLMEQSHKASTPERVGDDDAAMLAEQELLNDPDALEKAQSLLIEMEVKRTPAIVVRGLAEQEAEDTTQ